MFKPWKYTGYTFDDDISAYIKDDGPGWPAVTMGRMAQINTHLRVR